MMNVQSTGAADATAASSSTSKKSTERNEGFSDALSGFDKDGTSSKAPRDDSNATAHEAAGEDEQAVSRKSRPIIDIRPESLRKPSASIELTGAHAEDVSAAEQAKGSKETRQLTAAEKKLKEALANAKALTDKSDAAERAKGNLGEDDIDVDALLAADGADIELSDILSLLNGAGAAGAASAMDAGGAKAQAASTAKRGQADADGVRGKTSALSAMDALTQPRSAEADPVALPGDAGGASEQDRLFRFQSAKGDRQSMDMVIGGNADRMSDTRSSGNGSAETVTVLDSRRFLGLAPNASALTSALSGDKEWSAAMQSTSNTQALSAQNGTGNVVNTLKLQMTPHDLGSVTAMLRLSGEQLNVHLTVETRAAYRQLADDSTGILDALRSQGFSVDQVTISIAPTADADSASNQQAGQNGQQASAQGERQGSAAGRGQDNASGRQSSEQAAGNGNDGASENPAVSGSGSGQLYL